MAYLPSKKFIIVTLIILLAGGGAFWFFKGKKKENNPLFPRDKSSLSLNFGQGEKNWKEVLWEIASSGPGVDPKIFAAKDSSGETGGLTKTDALARDFFANFLALQQSGNLNQENKDKLTESFLANIGQEKFPDKYTFSDFKIIKDNNNEAFKNYGNKLEDVIKKCNSMIKEDELVIINNALQTQDENELKKLEPLIQLYRDTAQDLLKLEVPQNLAQYHLEVLNGINNFPEAFLKIQNVFKDPVQGIMGISQYQKEYIRVGEAIQSISQYLKNI